MLKENDYENFYYNAGAYLGHYINVNFGPISTKKKIRIVNDFKRFIDSYGGVDSFQDSQMAVKQFFCKIAQGGKNVRKKH